MVWQRSSGTLWISYLILSPTSTWFTNCAAGASSIGHWSWGRVCVCCVSVLCCVSVCRVVALWMKPFIPLSLSLYFCFHFTLCPLLFSLFHESATHRDKGLGFLFSFFFNKKKKCRQHKRREELERMRKIHMGLDIDDRESAKQTPHAESSSDWILTAHIHKLPKKQFLLSGRATIYKRREISCEL